MEIYYAIINIVSYLASSKIIDEDEQNELKGILDKLLALEAKNENSTLQETFDAITDANDVGGVKNWDEMIEEFKELIVNGKRT